MDVRGESMFLPFIAVLSCCDKWARKCGGWSYTLTRSYCRSPEQVTARLDRLISTIRTKYHAPHLEHSASGSPGNGPPCDVLVVAHGHILRAFAARWVGRPVHDNPSLLLEAGGVGCLSYEHNKIDEPAILLGGAFVVDVAEGAKEEGKEEVKEGK